MAQLWKRSQQLISEHAVSLEINDSIPQGSRGNLSAIPKRSVQDWSLEMSNAIVVGFLAMVAVAPMAYLGIMASAVQRSDNKKLALSGAN